MADEVWLGGYRRTAVIQTGQNSEVWEVVDSANHKYVLKLLLRDKKVNPNERTMLRHEASVGKTLKHPKIIRIHKLGRDAGTEFIVMEHFPSTNLKLRLLRKEFDSFLHPNLRKLLEQSANALEFLHQQRWVHRDIKPDNVLANNLAEVRLIDFALAKRPAGFFSGWFGRSKKTAGTMSYMSPEQVRGQPLDARADIYSFGIMVYELLVGKCPFVANSAGDLLRKHLTDNPPPLPRELAVTSQFDELMRRMLVKKREQRLAKLSDFLSALRTMKIFEHETLPTPDGVVRTYG